MRFYSTAVAGLATLLLSCGAKGPTSGEDTSPVGTWTVDVAGARPLAEQWVTKEIAAAPASERAAGRKRLEQVIHGILERSVLRATIRADHTATLYVKRDAEESTLTGTWSEAKGIVTVVAARANGAPATKSDARPVPFPHRDGRLWFEVQIGLLLPLARE